MIQRMRKDIYLEENIKQRNYNMNNWQIEVDICGCLFYCSLNFSVSLKSFRIKKLGNEGESLETKTKERENKQMSSGLRPSLSTSILTLGKLLNASGFQFPV